MKRIAVILSAVLVILSASALRLSGQAGQRPGGAGGPGGPGGRGAVQANLPIEPTAVSLPTMSEEVTGPGPMFDSTPSLPGKGLATYRYEVKEYFVSGTANGQPYKTRLVVRRPANGRPFSGLVLAESMHSSGAAHMFEFTSTYTMASGHAAVEILTTGPMQFTQFNQE